MAILISTRYLGPTNTKGLRMSATIGDSFNQHKYRAIASYSEPLSDDFKLLGRKPKYLSDSQTASLNAAFKALRKWVDTTALESGPYPVTRWGLEWIGETHRGEDIVRAIPFYESETEAA